MQPLLQWKSVRTTYSKSVFVALRIEHAMRMLYTDVCSLSGFTIFFILSHKRQDFRKKKIIENKMLVFICTINLVSNISHSEKD